MAPSGGKTVIHPLLGVIPNPPPLGVDSLLYNVDDNVNKGEEISAFPCNTRPVAGETWYIPLGHYPFNDDGRLKDERCKSATVRIKNVMVTLYSGEMPKATMTIVGCEIIKITESFLPGSWQMWSETI